MLLASIIIYFSLYIFSGKSLNKNYRKYFLDIDYQFLYHIVNLQKSWNLAISVFTLGQPHGSTDQFYLKHAQGKKYKHVSATVTVSTLPCCCTPTACMFIILHIGTNKCMIFIFCYLLKQLTLFSIVRLLAHIRKSQRTNKASVKDYS